MHFNVFSLRISKPSLLLFFLEFRLTLLARDLSCSSYRWLIIVLWFRIEAMTTPLPRRGNYICQSCWLISHFNATVSGLYLKVTFCGEVIPWNRARADIFVLHLGANIHLCHYFTARNGFTDKQDTILPAEICKMFFYSNGISVKLTITLMSQIQPILLWIKERLSDKSIRTKLL